MRKLYLNVFLISWMVMLSAAACGAHTQPKSLMGSALEILALRTDR